jgi:hypothetical protein
VILATMALYGMMEFEVDGEPASLWWDEMDPVLRLIGAIESPGIMGVNGIPERIMPGIIKGLEERGETDILQAMLECGMITHNNPDLPRP